MVVKFNFFSLGGSVGAAYSACTFFHFEGGLGERVALSPTSGVAARDMC